MAGDRRAGRAHDVTRDVDAFGAYDAQHASADGARDRVRDGAVAASGGPRPAPARAPFAGWPGALREVAVIAAGALAALGAQAWWQDRQDRGRERDYLRQLLVDTRENEQRLAEAIGRDSTTRQEIQRITRALYTPGPTPSADTLLAWFGGTTFFASNFQPVAGTYAALVSTGDLRLIRTDSLRALVIAYAGALEDGRRNQDFYRQQAFGDASQIARALPFLEPMWAGGRSDVIAPSVDVGQLRRDPNVMGVLFTLETANVNRLGNLRTLRGETRRLRRALEAER